MEPDQLSPKNVSITVLLTTAIGVLVLLSVSIVLALSAYSNIANTSELLERSSNQLIDMIEQRVRSHINPVRFVAEHIKRQAASGSIDFSDKYEMVLTMKASLAGVPDLTGVATWRPNGHELLVIRDEAGKMIISSKQAFNDAEFRVNFENLSPKVPAVWAEPWREGNRTLITYFTGVFSKGKTIGAVGAGISLANLSRVIGRIEENTGFTAFVLYGNDRILAHRALPDFSTASISKSQPLFSTTAISDGVLAQFANVQPSKLLSGKGFNIRNVNVGGNAFFVISRPFTDYGNTPWNIGVYAPRKQLAIQLRRLAMSIMAGIVLLILSIVAAFLLARRVARPIKVISRAAADIGSLELDAIPALPPSRITELNNQSKAFNQMLEGLKWFESYVPRKLVGRLIKQHSNEAVQSRQEELTVMFTDLIGFTKMSENLSPADTADMVNKHFSLVNTCIENTDGTLDKYIGDAVMAFWGAPESQADHARRACEAAMLIAEQMEKEDTGLRMKIALHTGPLIVGNIGAPGRMNYTVIGDTVNTCSRIEKLAGKLDDGGRVFILLSEQVKDAAGEFFITVPAGEFSVKGRRKTVKVFQLTGRKKNLV